MNSSHTNPYSSRSDGSIVTENSNFIESYVTHLADFLIIFTCKIKNNTEKEGLGDAQR
jgi:hypothetical protein